VPVSIGYFFVKKLLTKYPFPGRIILTIGKEIQIMADTQKADLVNRAMQEIEGDFRRENRAQTAARVMDARIQLMASPDSAAKLYDILTKS